MLTSTPQLPVPARRRAIALPVASTVTVALAIANGLALHSFLLWLVVAAGGLFSLMAWGLRKAERQAIVVEGGDPAEQRLARLKRALNQARYEVTTEKPGERAAEQLKQVQERYRNLERVLREKLDPSELTFGRYRGAAREVVDSVLDRLEGAASQLASVAAMKIDEVAIRKRELERLGAASEAERTELVALEQRLELKDAQMKTVDGVLVDNERALTELDRVAVALAGMKSHGDRVSADMDLLMKDLEDLAGRAKRYSKQGS